MCFIIFHVVCYQRCLWPLSDVNSFVLKKIRMNEQRCYWQDKIQVAANFQHLLEGQFRNTWLLTDLQHNSCFDLILLMWISKNMLFGIIDPYYQEFFVSCSQERTLINDIIYVYKCDNEWCCSHVTFRSHSSITTYTE